MHSRGTYRLTEWCPVAITCILLHWWHPHFVRVEEHVCWSLISFCREQCPVDEWSRHQLQIRYHPNPRARYVDLFEDHPQASANADVLTAYLGWVLNVGTLVICQLKHPPLRQWLLVNPRCQCCRGCCTCSWANDAMLLFSWSHPLAQDDLQTMQDTHRYTINEHVAHCCTFFQMFGSER